MFNKNFSCFNSMKQLNNDNNGIKKKYINRSRIPIKPVLHNFNSISKIKNINNSIEKEEQFLFEDKSDDLQSYNYSNYNKKNNFFKNGRVQSFQHLSYEKTKPEMNIMINNGIIKNIYVNRNTKNKLLFKEKYRSRPINQNHHNNFFNNLNKIKESIYNDYNQTFQNINRITNNFNKNIINRTYNKNPNFNSTSKNIKTFTHKSFNGKKLLKNNIKNNNNINGNIQNKKIKQIPISIPISKNYLYLNNNMPSQRRNSYENNTNIYNNVNNNLYQSTNCYSKTNIYETNNNNIRDKIYSIPIPIQNAYLIPKPKNNNNKNFNKKTSPKNNNKIYNKTENNNVQNNLISSSSSDVSNELSVLAEDILNILKKEKIKKKEKKNNLKEICIKTNKNIINKNLVKEFNINNNIPIKKNNNDSTEENFDLIDKIINATNLEEKNKKNRKLFFDIDKNIFIKYNSKEKIGKNDNKMEFYLTLLKSKNKFNSVLKNFDRNEIRINKNYILNENLEEYEMLGDLYNIFYLKDINDLDNKLKHNIDNLIK